MPVESSNVKMGYFNLKGDGDSAIVRLLHSSVKTIERFTVHSLNIDGKVKNLKCLTEDCILCEKNVSKYDRIAIHLFDYSDNSEKVWSRTDKILDSLFNIEQNWGDLSNCVLKITRIGDNFPKYSIDILNSNNYSYVDKSRVDISVKYMCCLTRSRDELEEYFATGVMPKHNANKPTSSNNQLNTEIANMNYGYQQSQQAQAQAPFISKSNYFGPVDGGVPQQPQQSFYSNVDQNMQRTNYDMNYGTNNSTDKDALNNQPFTNYNNFNNQNGSNNRFGSQNNSFNGKSFNNQSNQRGSSESFGDMPFLNNKRV